MDRSLLIKQFDKLSPFTDRMIERGIETHRKGLFAVRVLDGEGKPMANVPVHVKLHRHAFKFGCSLFLLEQFPEAERNLAYRDEFRRIFNYGV